MKINGQEFVIIGANSDELAAFLNEQYPTRESLIGSTITAYGSEFVMLEENLGMHWIQFFMQLMDTDTTGLSATTELSATLGSDDTTTRPNIRWTFKESDECLILT